MSTLPTRQLGKNGPQVTALGFGGFLPPYFIESEHKSIHINISDISQHFLFS